MKGYHYTILSSYEKIKKDGLLPAPLTDENVLVETRDTEGIWLFQKPQEDESLFGMLVDRFVRHRSWLMVELEVDFEIKDCLNALDERDTLMLTHTGSMGDGINVWTYHEDEPIIIVREKIPVCQIRLRRKFNIQPWELQANEAR